MSGPVVLLVGLRLPAEGLRHALEAVALKEQMNGRDARLWVEAAARVGKLSAAAQVRAALLPRPRPVALNGWARQHGIPVSTARRWAMEGHLPSARKPGSSWVVDETEQPLVKGKHHGKASD